MQFITGGPDIPEEIEQARKNNELVLFCGAGISAHYGLPTFKDLVEQIGKKFNIDIKKDPLLKKPWEKEQYDSVLDLIEGDDSLLGSREELIKAVISILEKRETKETQAGKNKKNSGNNHKGMPEIHKALLDLSALPENKGYRLVTTNFDRLFFKAGLDPALSDSAPKLALPRKEEWKNLTFLHGVIDEKHDLKESNLILTRKDFGRAYLHDNWVAQFVIRLLQDFTVLFIGYGVNDPVMNYLVSAISYENQRKKQNDNKINTIYGNPNENSNKIKPSIYAFAEYKDDKEKEAKNEWKSLGVEPIPYQIKKNNDHSTLYNTIKQWADWKNTGLANRKNWLKEKLKFRYEDYDKWIRQQIIFFLKTDNKLAEYLSQINYITKSKTENELKPHKPVDISWLRLFNENGLLDKLVHSAPLQMPLWENLSPIEYHITNWLLHHLDKKELIHWVIDRGCILHPRFKYIIRREIQYKEKTNTSFLEKRKLLFLETVVDNHYLTYQLDEKNNSNYDIIKNLNKQYCSIKAQQLLEALNPYIHFKCLVYDEKNGKTYKTELKINADLYPDVKLKSETTLLSHAEDFSNLLKKAMDLAKRFEIIKNEEDPFYSIRFSIEHYTQNTKDKAWTYLIDLTRDSFDLAMKKNKPLARLLLSKWQCYPYSIFYRLILYAVTKYPEFEENITLSLLASNPDHTLWSYTAQHEVFRYLRHRKHSKEAVKKLFSLIMEGPPRIKKDMDEKFFIEWKERNIYERLDNLKQSEVLFPEKIEKSYKEIQKKYSLKSLKNDEQCALDVEPAVWVGSQKRYHNLSDEKIYEDLKNPKTTMWPGEKEREFRSLATDKPDKAFEVLKFADDIENAIYWNAFLNGITNISDTQKSNEYLKKALKKIENKSDEFIKQCLQSLIDTWDLKNEPVYYKDRQYFEKWWKRLWNLSIKNTKNFKLDDSNFSMSTCISTKLGKLSQFIFHSLWSGSDKTVSKIPEEIKKYFYTIIKTGAKVNPSVMFHFGFYLCKLWCLDREWTKKNIKPLMDWEKDKNIPRALWEGYTYHIQLNHDFLSDFKTEFFHLFLNAKNLYKTSSDNQDNKNRCHAVADLFLIATGGKWHVNIFTKEETKKLKIVLDKELLKYLSKKIWDLLKDSGGKSSSLWKKIKPWIEEFWPHQNNMKTPETAENLSFVILYCGDKLPEAFKLLEYKIKGIIKKNHYPIIRRLAGAVKDNKNPPDCIFNYPKELLELLYWNLPELKILYSFDGKKLKIILDKLKNKHPDIEQNENYNKLLEKILCNCP